MPWNLLPCKFWNVIPGIHSPVSAGTRPRLLLKWDQFAAATSIIGCSTDSSRARLLQVDDKTIHNLKNGGPVGDKTVAMILSVLRSQAELLTRHDLSVDFDDLFEVVVDEAA